MQLVEPCSEIALTDDGIAPIDGLGLVAGELHGHATRHAGPLQVPNGCAPEVMRNHTRYTSRLACRQPSRSKVSNALPVPLEHPRDDLVERCLQICSDTPLCFEQIPQGRQMITEREQSAVSILVVPGSSLTVPACRSTCRHSSESTSLGMRQPVSVSG
jgi:hypothetical protein